MSDESKTQEQADPRSFEERVFARFDAMEARLGRMEARLDRMETRLDRMETRLDGVDGRLASLEEKVDARLRETRPMWEAMQAQLRQIGDGIDDINRQFREVAFDSLKMRARVAKLEDRERPPAA